MIVGTSQDENIQNTQIIAWPVVGHLKDSRVLLSFLFLSRGRVSHLGGCHALLLQDSRVAPPLLSHQTGDWEPRSVAGRAFHSKAHQWKPRALSHFAEVSHIVLKQSQPLLARPTAHRVGSEGESPCLSMYLEQWCLEKPTAKSVRTLTFSPFPYPLGNAKWQDSLSQGEEKNC